MVYVYKRPYFDELIDFCFDNFDVAIWTAASKEYTMGILPKIFGERFTKLKFVFDGDRCTKIINRQEPYLSYCTVLKDLFKVRRRNFEGKRYHMGRVLMVDDISYNFSRNYGNGIKVEAWSGSVIDDQLKRLKLYLSDLLNTQESWRRIEKRGWSDRYSLDSNKNKDY
jgi:TFIIF-interacting CTD phosphatase-like protein